MPPFDVAVVGAGPGGSATAAFLAERGFSVALLDRACFPRDKPCAEYVSPEARRILDGLLPDGALAAADPAELKGMRIVSADGTSFEGRFLGSHPYRGYATHGIALRRSELDTALVEAATRRGAQLMERASVGRIDEPRGGVRALGVRQGRERRSVSARLIVGADGLHSQVAKQLGLARRGSVSRVALVTHAVGVRDMRPIGEMHVCDAGYVGLAPVGHGLTNVSVVVDTSRVTIGGAPVNWFQEMLARFPEVWRRLELATYVTPLRGAGPFARRTTRATAERVALVGDAADFCDPFTGEGIFSALSGAELLGEHVSSLIETDQLAQQDLRSYDRVRRRTFRGKWWVERIISWVVGRPAVLDHVARRLRAKPHLADLLVGVTGDFVPAGKILRPAYARQLVW